MKRKRRQLTVRLSDAARAALKADYPQTIKMRLLLAIRNGRIPRHCLMCQGHAVSFELYVPKEWLAVTVHTDRLPSPRVYVLCGSCKQSTSTEAQHAKLLRHQEQGRPDPAGTGQDPVADRQEGNAVRRVDPLDAK